MTDAPKTEPSRSDTLFQSVWGDKTQLGADFRKRAKQLFPDISLPEDGMDAVVAPVKVELDEVKGQLAKALERISAREKADEDLRAENDMSIKLSNARRSFGLTDAGFDKMMARMKETGNVTDAEAAAAWVVSQTPKPAPTNTPSWMPEASNLFGSQHKEEQFEALHRDPRKYMDDQLRAFAADPDKYVAETFGTA